MSSSKAWPVLFAVLLLALIVQAAILYPRLKGKDAEIASLREATQAQSLRETERVDPRQLAVQAEELTRLRKDNQELHRLRNEVRQLREATQLAAKAAQPAATAPAAAEVVSQLQRRVEQLQMENAQLRAAQQRTVQIQAQAQAEEQVNACINNLRMIDGAKQQWALENAQTAEAVPQPADIEPYLRDSEIPACPAGGVYTLNAVGLPPLCGVPGHALQ